MRKTGRSDKARERDHLRRVLGVKTPKKDSDIFQEITRKEKTIGGAKFPNTTKTFAV